MGPEWGVGGSKDSEGFLNINIGVLEGVVGIVREFKILVFENCERSQGYRGIFKCEYWDLEGCSRMSRALLTNISTGLKDPEAEYRGPFKNVRAEKNSRDIEGFIAIIDEL